MGGLALYLLHNDRRVVQSKSSDLRRSAVLAVARAPHLIQLTHAHPDGWGSKAILRTIIQDPGAGTCMRVAEEMQRHGYAVVDNLYEGLCVEKLGYDVASILEKHKDADANVTVTDYGSFVAAAIESLSTTFLHGLSAALSQYDERMKAGEEGCAATAYTHHAFPLCAFSGFNGTQLRLRLPGDGLDVHVDRSSACVTILYYLNDCEGGEIVLHVLDDIARQDPTNRDVLLENGGLSLMGEYKKGQEVTEGRLVPVSVQPKANTLVAFWSDCIPHEVLAITSPRLAFQIWYSTEKPSAA